MCGAGSSHSSVTSTSYKRSEGMLAPADEALQAVRRAFETVGVGFSWPGPEHSRQHETEV
jgi:hypothetical protein